MTQNGWNPEFVEWARECGYSPWEVAEREPETLEVAPVAEQDERLAKARQEVVKALGIPAGDSKGMTLPNSDAGRPLSYRRRAQMLDPLAKVEFA